MKETILSALFLFSTLSLFAQCDETLTEGEKNSIYNIDRIEVKGLIDRPTTLTVDSLKKMKVYTGGPFQVKSKTGEVKKDLKSFKGVLLKDILTRSGIKLESKAAAGTYPFEKGSYYVLLTATNGYRLMFTYNELMLTDVGENTYIVFEENGKEVSDGGKMFGFCITDRVTGARNIKWIKTIELAKL